MRRPVEQIRQVRRDPLALGEVATRLAELLTELLQVQVHLVDGPARGVQDDHGPHESPELHDDFPDDPRYLSHRALCLRSPLWTHAYRPAYREILPFYDR